MVVGIAILGAGIFATEEHLPAIRSVPALSLKAIYSRSQKSAETLAKTAGPGVEAYYEIPATSDRTLDALLKRPDVEAISVAVPISKSPDLIRRAFEAGKSVLSEKPIAPTVAQAQDLMKLYQKQCQSKQIVWAVGENFRFWNSVNRAAGIIRQLDAKILTFRCEIYHFIGVEDKYFHSDWRQTASHPAGFVLDACIHFVAILRFLLAAGGHTLATAAASAKLLDPALPPVDTVFALLETDKAVTGTFRFSVGIPFLDGIDYDIVTDKGVVHVQGPTVVTTRLRNAAGIIVESKFEDEMTFGVLDEFASFGAALNGSEMDTRISFQEALLDLQLLEAMLKSNGESVSIAC
ncbi:hypothetical protein PV08_02500 [Exophiala spinifera]|uniref:Gfo/Idh/MocA-like oxidoreductase N-terminal domain-containing protein n=1 Tax=Exophiala spinifera TaxID=91928 RepID=A0A0D1ZZQ4_9EURO|nr:uncharacterized protein PV08_02500 [Exophiala spinifera]KIW18212.1 hypothetical protein PV08_02500 [Exophiala spinifera]